MLFISSRQVRNNVDGALSLLRKALKKDRANVFLYQHVFDICYERQPMDVRGVTAAVTLAVNAKDLPLSEKVGEGETLKNIKIHSVNHIFSHTNFTPHLLVLPCIHPGHSAYTR